MRVLIDLTEFFSRPHRTGIQRVCGELCRFLPSEYAVTLVKLTKAGRLVVLPTESLSLMRQYFEACAADIPRLNDALNLAADKAEMSAEAVDCRTGDKLLVPEVFYEISRLDFYQNFIAERPKDVYFVLYDLLPLTHPDFFPLDLPHEQICRYFRLVRMAQNVSFISELTRKVYYHRLLRRSPTAGPILRLGSDGFGPRPASVPARHPSPKFAVIGTIEPRKNHGLILDVFETLFGQVPGLRLIFLGNMAWVDSSLSERIRSMAAGRCPGFEYYTNPDDGFIRQQVQDSWATIYVSVAEGFGLPPVESLWLGTPVIASSAIPSLETTRSTAVHIVDPLDAQSLRRAVLAMTEEPYARLKSEEALSLKLPTWRSFSSEVAAWLKG